MSVFERNRTFIIKKHLFGPSEYKKNLKYAKMKKSFFLLEDANISQLFLLDKLVSGQGL